MRKFRVVFQVRRAGAIGAFADMQKDFDAETPEQARDMAFDYWHEGGNETAGSWGYEITADGMRRYEIPTKGI